MQYSILVGDPPRIRPDDFQEVLKIAFRGKQKHFDLQTVTSDHTARTPKVATAELGPIEWQCIPVVVDVDFFDRVQPGGSQPV
jgi:hypothetical protein